MDCQPCVTSNAQQLRVVQQLLWDVISKHLYPAERDEIRRALGGSLLDENEALFAEAGALADILGDVQLDTAALLARHQLCSNPQRSMVESEILQLVERLHSSAAASPFGSAAVRERDPQELLPRGGRRDKQLLEYVSTVAQITESGGRPPSAALPPRPPSAASASRPGTSSRPHTAASTSRPGTSSPTALSTSFPFALAHGGLSAASRPSTASSAASSGGGGRYTDAPSVVAGVADQLSLATVEAVREQLRGALMEEKAALMEDIEYLQGLLDAEADLQVRAAAPPPSLAELRDYSSRLAAVVADEEARVEHEVRVSAMFAAAEQQHSRAGRLRGMVGASRRPPSGGSGVAAGTGAAAGELLGDGRRSGSSSGSGGAGGCVQRLVVHGGDEDAVRQQDGQPPPQRRQPSNNGGGGGAAAATAATVRRPGSGNGAAASEATPPLPATKSAARLNGPAPPLPVVRAPTAAAAASPSAGADGGSVAAAAGHRHPSPSASSLRLRPASPSRLVQPSGSSAGAAEAAAPSASASASLISNSPQLQSARSQPHRSQQPPSLPRGEPSPASKTLRAAAPAAAGASGHAAAAPPPPPSPPTRLSSIAPPGSPSLGPLRVRSASSGSPALAAERSRGGAISGSPMAAAAAAAATAGTAAAATSLSRPSGGLEAGLSPANSRPAGRISSGSGSGAPADAASVAGAARLGSPPLPAAAEAAASHAVNQPPPRMTVPAGSARRGSVVERLEAEVDAVKGGVAAILERYNIRPFTPSSAASAGGAVAAPAPTSGTAAAVSAPVTTSIS